MGQFIDGVLAPKTIKNNIRVKAGMAYITAGNEVYIAKRKDVTKRQLRRLLGGE